ncbi:MAG: hypothetical protein ACYDA9_10465 [Terriglobia bacterium]
MAEKKASISSGSADNSITPVVAATLAGVIYQSRLLNRQAKLNIPENEIVTDVINTWRTVMDALARPKK